MKVSIIIPLRDQVEHTIRCLDALLRNDCDDIADVIIVDNNSGDETVKFLDEFSWGKVRLIRNTTPLNFSQSCNQGASLTKGEALLFLNNDVTVAEGWLEPLISTLSEIRGIVGARLLFPDGRLQHCGEVYPLWGVPFIGGVGEPGINDGHSGRRVRWGVIGALMLIDKGFFQRLGGFDEGFEFGLEDIDLCFKVRACGEKITCVDAGPIYHHASASISITSVEVRSARFANNLQRFRIRWSALFGRLAAYYLRQLERERIHRVALLGAGKAGRISLEIFRAGGVEVTSFYERGGADIGNEIDGVMIRSLDNGIEGADCLLVTSQYQWKLSQGLDGINIPVRSIEFSTNSWTPGDQI